MEAKADSLTFLHGNHGTAAEPETQRVWGQWWASQVIAIVAEMEADHPIALHFENSGYIPVNSTQELMALAQFIEKQLGVSFTQFIIRVEQASKDDPVIKLLRQLFDMNRLVSRGTHSANSENYRAFKGPLETAAISDWLVEESKTRPISIVWEDPPFESLLSDICEMANRTIAIYAFHQGRGEDALGDIRDAERRLANSIQFRDEKLATEIAGSMISKPEFYHFSMRGLLHSMYFPNALSQLSVSFNVLEQPSLPSYGRAQRRYFEAGLPDVSEASGKLLLIRRSMETLMMSIPLEGIRGFSLTEISDAFELLNHQELIEWFSSIANQPISEEIFPIMEVTVDWLIDKKVLSNS